MKLLIITDIYPSDENPIAGIFIKEQVEHLKKDHEVRVMVVERRFVRIGVRSFLRHIFREHSDKRDEEGIIRIKYPVFIVFKKALYILDGFIAYVTASKKLNETGFRPDLIYAHKSFPAGYVGWKLKKQYNAPVVTIEFQGPFSSYFNEPYRGSRVLKTINHVDRTIYTGFQLREIQACGIKGDRLGIAYYGIDTNKFSLDREGAQRRRSETARGRFRLLVVGRVEEEKGIRYLLEAIRIVIKEFPDIQLSIVGPLGQCGQELLASIEKMRLEKNVAYKGICANSELPSLINEHDILVSASLFETFGVTIIEALACGKPVVATKSGGPDGVVNEKVGVLVEKANPQALAESIRHVIVNYERYDQEEIREYAVKNFGHEVVTKRLNRLFEEVSRGH
ncbi:MAG: glycosyltransferase [Nitrospirae bacterium]|nr:glycosyltransferase [Nitrospirota bacterium]